MLKSILMALSLGASSIAISSSATAQVKDVAPASKVNSETSPNKDDKEINQMQKIFGAMFGPANNEPIDPQRLILAQQAVAKIMPKGIYAKMMGGIMDKAMGSMLGGPNGMGDFEIMIATGVEVGEAKIDQAKRAAITQLLDSNYAERSKLMRDMMAPMFDKMISAIEPSMREGMSRAYARKFTPLQLTELNRFFTTPTGGFYASEAFALQADPEVMQAMMSVLPTIISEMKLPSAEIEAKMKALPKARTLDQFTTAELDTMAQLLGTTSEALKEHSKVTVFNDEAGDAVADATADPYANETGEEPWYNEDSWTPAQRKKIAALSAKSEAAAEKQSVAYESYSSEYDNAIATARDKLKADYDMMVKEEPPMAAEDIPANAPPPPVLPKT